jgi:hypothetical protein
MNLAIRSKGPWQNSDKLTISPAEKLQIKTRKDYGKRVAVQQDGMMALSLSLSPLSLSL